MDNLNGGNSGHSRDKVVTIAAGILVALSVLTVDTSCTAPPKCAPGQHVERMPSHQHYMWHCVPHGIYA